jgi:hypothetical protein
MAALVILIDGYVHTVRMGHELEDAFPLLQAARSDLTQGASRSSPAIERAALAVGRVRADLALSDPSAGWIESIPFLGRPVEAIRLGVSAATNAERALSVATGILDELKGQGGSDGKDGLIHDSTVDIGLVRGLVPRMESTLNLLQAADRDLRAIPHLPFLGRLDDLKAQALRDSADAIRLARRGLSAIRLVPSMLGADGARTYFLALQNNADQRGTGGAVLAYALVQMDQGHITFLEGGPVADLDQGKGVRVPTPPAVRWYLRATTRPARINNGVNYTPDFPPVASTWAKQVEKVTGREIDGVIALDPVAVSYALRGQPPLVVSAYRKPIDAANIVEVTEYRQYRLPVKRQIELPNELIGAAYGLLTNPRDVFAMGKNLTTALAERRMQLWFRDPQLETLLTELGWDGALKRTSADYLLAVDEKRNVNKVDYFTHQSIHYTLRILPSGDADATATVNLSNTTPPDEPVWVVGNWTPYALNVAMLNLYVPERASFLGVTPSGPIRFKTRPRGFRQHIESGRFRVFTKTTESWPGHPGVVTFHYRIPDVVQAIGAERVYRLIVQHQPLAQPADLTVTVVLPSGSVVQRTDPGWSVQGTVATFNGLLTRDLITSLAYS